MFAVLLSLCLFPAPARDFARGFPAAPRPKLQTTPATVFWIDGRRVTAEQFLAVRESVELTRVVVDGDEITVMEARTKGK